jgi:precorrin-6B methylase 2
MDYKGEKFLKNIGIQRNQFVLDFGSRYGTYTIPAAKLVGKKGKIYAVDKNMEYLDKLLHTAKKIGLNM